MTIPSASARYESLELVRWWNQTIVREATVFVAGAGALGNEILKNLALLGAGTVHVCDFDTIETGNLLKSVLFRDEDVGQAKVDVVARRVTDLNPQTQVHPHYGNLFRGVGLGFLFDCTVILSAVDSLAARVLLNRYSLYLGTPWVDGGISLLDGSVSVYVPGSGCIECWMQDEDWATVDRRASCEILARKLPPARIATTPTIASIIGGIQTQECVKLLHGNRASAGRRFFFHGSALSAYVETIAPGAHCLRDCGETPPATRVTLDRRPVALRDLFAEGEALSGEPLTLDLLWDYVGNVLCPSCSTESFLGQPRILVDAVDGICPRCGAEQTATLVSRIGKDEADLFAISSFPPDHLFAFTGESGRSWLFRC